MADVFLHDRVAGTTTLVSHASGTPAPGDFNFSDLDVFVYAP